MLGSREIEPALCHANKQGVNILLVEHAIAKALVP